uniref:Bacteriophage/Gene transfer agent portal protein n=1 Tax=uncultured Caudovirales phage TaxID=2100421 RepID=A0A6J5LAA1_9CAUD|nr:Bacteriophage/Gene transfer agent portal protein [uncultured Caudovirales phage]
MSNNPWDLFGRGGEVLVKAYTAGLRAAIQEMTDDGDDDANMVDAEVLSKAVRAPQPGQPLTTPSGRSQGAKAWEFDPLDAATAQPDVAQGITYPGSYYGVTYETLRYMGRVPPVSLITQTMINKASEYLHPRIYDSRVGYRFALKDSKAKPTKANLTRMQELSEWFYTCGDPRIQSIDNANLPVTMSKFLRDSILVDQAVLEKVRTRGGKLAGFVAADGATFRRAALSKDELARGRRSPDATAFVQVIQNRVVARFEPEDLIFFIRRPRTDLRSLGYGYPELDELVRTITNIVNTDLHNGNNFTHGVHTSSIIGLKSKMNEKAFKAFRREFYAMLSGAQNSHKTPIIQLDPDEKEDIVQVNLSNTNKEMEFEKWQARLDRIVYGLFQMDRAESGIVDGNEGQTSAMQAQGPADRISASEDRWLWPLLRKLETMFNTHIVDEIAPEYRLTFGLDEDDQNANLELAIKRVGKLTTVNEERAKLDLPPLKMPAPGSSPADWGPLDPTFINAVEQAMAAAQPQPGAPGEMPPDGGEPPPDDGQQPDGGEGGDLDPGAMVDGDGSGPSYDPEHLDGLYPGGDEGEQPGGEMSKSLKRPGKGRKLRIEVR